MMVPRHELWRKNYRDRRYMRHIDETSLKERARDVFNNLIVLTPNAKIGLPPINRDGEYWMVLWTHVLEEFVLRFGAFPAGFQDGFMQSLAAPQPRHPLAVAAGRAVTSRSYDGETHLVKYGRARYLRTACETGRLRIAPASYYSDPSLHPAVRDNELEIVVTPPPSGFRITTIDKSTGRPVESIAPTHIKLTKKAATNYYVYCLSNAFVPRLFQDFDDADSCLIITKPDMFVDRLVAGFARALRGYDAHVSKVTYVDPLNPRELDIDVYGSKHFRYSYQKEYRIVWLPQAPRRALEPLLIDCGSMTDCCELLDLNDLASRGD